MHATFTKTAALAFAILLAAGGSALVSPTRGMDPQGGLYVPAPTPPDQRNLQGPVSRLRGDTAHMYEIVSSYGGDNYARLRADVHDLLGSTDALQDAIDRRDSADIGRTFSDVRHAMDETDYRMRNVQIMTRSISDAWENVINSFHEVQDAMR